MRKRYIWILSLIILVSIILSIPHYSEGKWRHKEFRRFIIDDTVLHIKSMTIPEIEATLGSDDNKKYHMTLEASRSWKKHTVIKKYEHLTIPCKDLMHKHYYIGKEGHLKQFYYYYLTIKYDNSNKKLLSINTEYFYYD